MKPSTALLLAGAFGLGGCELAPPETLPTIAVPVSYKEATLWQMARPADALPRGDWWTLFGDPTLDTLESQVEQGNADLQVAVADYDQARAFAAEAEAGLFPQLTLGGTVSANRQSADRPLRSAAQPTYYGANTIDAQLDYELDVWGRVRDAVAAGRSLAEASAADLATTRLSLQAEMANDYLSWRGLIDEKHLLDATVAAYTTAANVTRARFEGDIASSIDVSRADTQLNSARAQDSDISSRLALLEHAIATLTGRSASVVTLPQDDVKLALPDVPPGVPSRLLERRPDIAAAERRVAASAKLVGVARAAFYPDVSLNLLGGFNATSLGLLSAPYSFWTLGSGLILPILDGGLRHAELTASQAALRSATATYRGTVLLAFQQVEDNLALLHWLSQEQAEEAAAAQAAQQTLDKAMTLYQDGATTFLDVVVAQTAALEAQRTVLELRTRVLQAEVGLTRALGGGWSLSDLPKPGEQQASLLDAVAP